MGVSEERTRTPIKWNLLDEANERCGEVCAEYAKTFLLGKFLLLIFTMCKQADLSVYFHSSIRICLFFLSILIAIFS